MVCDARYACIVVEAVLVVCDARYACVVVVEALLVVCDASYACVVVVEAVLVVCDAGYACVVVVEAVLVVCDASYACVVVVEAVLVVCDGSYACVTTPCLCVGENVVRSNRGLSCYRAPTCTVFWGVSHSIICASHLGLQCERGGCSMQSLMETTWFVKTPDS